MSNSTIIKLAEIVEQRVRKEKELEYYQQQLEEINKRMWFLKKELELTNLIIEIIENDKVVDIRDVVEDNRLRDDKS